MNYELALELKNAGFPQDGYGVWMEEPNNRREPYLQRTENACYVPTLSELIDTCGEDYGFGQLYRIGRKGKFGYHAESNVEPIVKGSGSTPEEAVARLWLAINKK